MKRNISRRGFLRGTLFGSIGAIFVDRMGWLFPEQQRRMVSLPRVSTSNALVQQSAEGELYAGFLLLPEGASIPAFVRPPEMGIPIFCGVGVGRGGPRPTAMSKSLSTVADLKKEVGFPIYTLGGAFRGLDPSAVNLIKHETGEIYAASVIFESIDKDRQSSEIVSITAHPDFSRPFPLWSCNPVEPDGPVIILEKVDLLPSAGILVATLQGYVFQWIEKDILYTFLAENNPTREDAELLARSLEAN